MRASIGSLEHPESGFDANCVSQTPDTDQTFFVGPTEVSSGPFRLLLTLFLLLQGEKPGPFGSRALEILTVLLERRGELASKQDLMTPFWPSVLVEPANLTIQVCRALHDGRDKHRFVNLAGLAAT
ncbi:MULTISPECIES: hypothetical protein [unclassified Bradyrhizobium]|uniref:winged helix-turn-helix domain-containing protein n=1 Tax=unclassified Bradyrhizobium TaxID=2631580 RepID=UPI0024794EC7|nr:MULTISPECIES: hypothetical protein [unclassified Bradyrhizobium]WGS19936.1 hypothetical protein MTX22_37420 [Bradyrhizobium sp. ISRA463]WGS26790.1 hypothetical protein MTX19_34870 [Bradyrhizobium sp. ISRA464]